MNLQALNGPVRLSYEFQKLDNSKRFDILMQISKSPHKSGTIGVWKWHIYKDVLVIAMV